MGAETWWMARACLSGVRMWSWLLAGTASGWGAALSPEAERETFELADGDLVVELVASEPEVISPVAMAWDADGRMFVVEMSDYPNGAEEGRVRMLEDKDGDGRYERSGVFARGLAFPTSVLPWRDGVLVTAAPDVLFLRDGDGDGEAEERRVLLTGFGEGNQQLRVNGLTHGLDNWIYGANGRSDGEVRWVAGEGSRPAEAVSLRGHDFRFRLEPNRLETLAGRSQFGLGRDDWGNRFLSWNTIPIRHDVVPDRYLARVRTLSGLPQVAELLPADDSQRVWPLTPAPLTFNQESTSHFNALAGLTIFRGEGLGPEYEGNVFAGESLRNLVHRRVLISDGPTFVALRGPMEEEREFLASRDPWFHPVNFATGPDGALYVADFYRRFVEHPDFVPARLRGDPPWREGAEHGRIWRVRRADRVGSGERPALSQAAAAELVKNLEHRNGWWRDTAQRLLVERGDVEVRPALERLAHGAAEPASRLQALWTLEGLGELRSEVLRVALADGDARVRRQAVLLAEERLDSDEAISGGVAELADDADAGVRFQVALSIGEGSRGGGKRVAWMKIAHRDIASAWTRTALLTSVGGDVTGVTRELLGSEAAWISAAVGLDFLNRLGQLGGATESRERVAACAVGLGRARPISSGAMAVLAGLGQGANQAGVAGGLKELSDPVTAARVTEEAVRHLRESERLEADRRSAMQVLVGVAGGEAGPELLRLVSAGGELGREAARALVRLEERGLAVLLYGGWQAYPAALRRAILEESVRRRGASVYLVAAVERGTIGWGEVDRDLQDTLVRGADRGLAERVAAFGKGEEAGGRDAVIERFRPALALEGEVGRGAKLFGERCLVCHRMGQRGQAVGPDLLGLAGRPADVLLVDVLDPSRNVALDFLSSWVETTGGDLVTGLVVEETGERLTLRLAGGTDQVIEKSQVKARRASELSLMPEGLEEGWGEKDLADLLSFLRHPDPALIP